ncbi:MAG: GNAT family N-acetyltransferase [Prevotella sp.]|nr:GNAT family N-acetyltransferase [Prevotella sp.]MCM1075622.1 GNAT family N-acetyltransferase [Ruminococcus sp.]
MFNVRKITDCETLLKWREEVIRNVFDISSGYELLKANRQFYAKHISDNTHIAVIASVDGKDCGCGAVCFSDELPSPDNPTGKCAYLMNIYVRPEFRKRGVAHFIVRGLINEALARKCGKIYLETTAEGRPVYESLGFADMNDMMKYRQAQ